MAARAEGASTIVSPGRGSRFGDAPRRRGRGRDQSQLARRSATSSALPSTSCSCCAPRGAIPDLEVVGHAGHRHLARDPGRLEQRRRDHQPALLVELDVGRAGEEVAPHPAAVRPTSGSTASIRSAIFAQRLDGPGVEAAIEAARHDDLVLRTLPELRRECEAVLLVQRMLVLTEQHGPLRPTLPHFTPPVNPRGPCHCRPSPPPRRRTAARSARPGRRPGRARLRRRQRGCRTAAAPSSRRRRGRRRGPSGCRGRSRRCRGSAS